MKATLYIFAIFILTSCIGEDIVDDFIPEVVRITSTVNEITIGDSEQLEALYFNNTGIQENDVTILWESSNNDILKIDSSGAITTEMSGEVTISATVGEVFDEINISVTNASEEEEEDNNTPPVELTQITGNIATTTFYDLAGNFTLTEIDGDSLELSFASNYIADDGLPGLYVYLTNNPNSIQGALEIGAVQTFSGEHTYNISDVKLNDFAYILYWCKPFSVKVGQGNLQN